MTLPLPGTLESHSSLPPPERNTAMIGVPFSDSKTMCTGCEGGPSPSRLVAKAVTMMLVDRAHREEAMSNQSLQTPLSQVEAEITVEPQM